MSAGFRHRPGKLDRGISAGQASGDRVHALEPIQNLKRPATVSEEEEKATRDLLGMLNGRHAARHEGNSDLKARVAAYELAARMQLSAPEVPEYRQRVESNARAVRHR